MSSSNDDDSTVSTTSSISRNHDVVIVRPPSNSSSVSDSSSFPLPYYNEQNDAYCIRLIPFIVKQQSETCQQLQSIGSIKYQIDRFTSTTIKLKVDHILIKNLWTLLCIVSGNSMSFQENKMENSTITRDLLINLANPFRICI